MGPPARVQRAVGFEFEDTSWTVFAAQQGKALRDPWWFESGTAAPQPEGGGGQFEGENVFKAPAGTATVNNAVARFDLQNAPKKGSLHDGPGYKIEPDGPYAEGDVRDRMDLEIVTDPFPETPDGLTALAKTLTDIHRVYNEISAHATGPWDGRTLSFANFVTPAQHRFSNPSVYLYGGARGGDFKPQVTGGFDLADLPRVLETLGTGREDPLTLSDDERRERGAVRDLVYGEAIGSRSEPAILGSAPRRAQRIVDQLVRDGVVSAEADGIDQLKGFLSLAVAYIVALSARSSEGIKDNLPLLSRYSFTSLWSQVPEPVRRAVAGQSASLIAGFDGAIGDATVPRFPSKACGDMRQPMLTVGLIYKKGTADLQSNLMAGLGSFTRAEWVLGILAGRDLLTPADLLAHFQRADATAQQKDVAGKYGKSVAVFLRGHGNTKNVKDVGGGPLAIVENRAIAPKTSGGGALVAREAMTIDEVLSLALQYFSWALKVKDAREQERGRKAARDQRLGEDASKARSLNLWG